MRTIQPIELPIGSLVTLRGITSHGKNIINRDGSVWKAISSNLTPTLVGSKITSITTGDTRWLTGDFEIVI